MTVDSSCPDRSVIRTIHVVRHLAPLAAMSHWVELGTNFQTRPCIRILTVKLKVSGKGRIQKFCHIQVIVFDLSYLPVTAVGILQVRNHEKK